MKERGNDNMKNNIEQVKKRIAENKGKRPTQKKNDTASFMAMAKAMVDTRMSK